MVNLTVSEKIELKNKAVAVANVTDVLVDRELFHGHKIARPSKDYFIFDNKLVIAGWVVGKTAVKSISVYLNEEVIGRAFLTIPRPGLTKKYEHLAEEYKTEFGFHQVIELPEIDQPQNIILKACFNDGVQHAIGTIELEPIDLEKDEKPSQISPDFIVIGAMKAATSAIYNYISLHSRVLERKPKEIHFFSKSHVYDQGWNWYLSQFAIKQKAISDRDILVGEASPSYISDLEAARKIKEAFPNIKIILSLRHPTDRAVSHYYHQVKRVKDEKRDIADAFSEAEIAKSIEAMTAFGNDELALRRKGNWETTRYLCNGLYAPQLKNWLKIFSLEQLLVLDYHQLETEPDIFLNKLFTFLNLEDELPSNVEKVYANKYADAPQEVIDRLNDYFKVYNDELKEIPGIDLSWS